MDLIEFDRCPLRHLLKELAPALPHMVCLHELLVTESLAEFALSRSQRGHMLLTNW